MLAFFSVNINYKNMEMEVNEWSLVVIHYNSSSQNMLTHYRYYSVPNLLTVVMHVSVLSDLETCLVRVRKRFMLGELDCDKHCPEPCR